VSTGTPGRSTPTGHEAWRDEAACRDADPELFFHEDEERGAAKQWRINQATAICRRCDVIYACREWSIETRQSHGIAGGLSENERTKEIRRRQRAGGARATQTHTKEAS